MSILDDPAALARNDPSGMLGHLEGFPEQLEEALSIGESADLSLDAEGVTSVVVLGMGGSAIGGELAAAHLSSRLAVPFVVNRDYAVPAFVNSETLVYVSSYSGNTEETLSAYGEAEARGTCILCATTGGRLLELANEKGRDIITIPGGYPPRAALGYGLVPLVVVLWRLGLIADPREEVSGAVETAREAVRRFGAAVPTVDNRAKQLAEWFRGHVPVVYGTAPTTFAVAHRWTGQLAENSKTIAHANELPEMNHNEIVGWGPTTVLAEHARVVFLRDRDDRPRTSLRVKLTAATIEDAGAEVRMVDSFGDSPLARMLSLVATGDFVSYYAASLAGVDPTPVTPIDRLKKALAEA